MPIKDEKVEKLPVGKGVKMAARYPKGAARILGQAFAQETNGLFSPKMKLTFLTLFIENLTDGKIAKQVDKELLERVSRMPLKAAIRLLKRYPEEGIEVLVALVSQELNDKQHLERWQQVDFATEFLDNLLHGKEAEGGE